VVTKVRVGDVVDVTVRAVAAGGAGVADLPDGRVAFVQRTAPGDRARVRVSATKRSWARATLVELVAPGPGRRPPPCPFYGRCGGCTLEHLEYPEQLRWKARMVADALERIGRVKVDAPVVEPSPCEFRYRNRVTFTLRRSRGAAGGVVAGFHEMDEPDRVVDVTGSCMLPEEAIARVWDGLRSAWGEAAERLPAGTTLRLTLRSVAEGVSLIVDGGSGAWTPDFLIQNVPGLVAVWHSGGNGPPVLMAGEASAGEVWLGEAIQPGARAFIQVNRQAAERLQAAVMQAVGAVAGRMVVDAYCGVGVYGRALARAGARVSGIEIDPEAAASAREDAPAGFSVIEGAVEDHLGDVLPADVVILNPPRTGVDNAVARALSDRRIVRIIYVSCDPATLARDVGRLQGYRLTRVEAFDLFPQTAHVETLALLECD